MPIYLHLVRHAQGVHNLGYANLLIPDPQLTPLGEDQCADLRRNFPHHDNLTHLVASPMRRTLQTCLISFLPSVEAGIKVVALPEIQEVSTLPSDVGRSPTVLMKQDEFKSIVDFSNVEEGWTNKGPGGPWAPRVDLLEARAAAARRFLRDMAREAEEATGRDVHIGVVSHGAILHYITRDWSNLTTGWTNWRNAECRSFEFVDPKSTDDDAFMRETDASWKARMDGMRRLTDAEQREVRESIQAQMQIAYDTIIEKQKAGTLDY